MRLITKEVSSKVVDHSKIRKERVKNCSLKKERQEKDPCLEYVMYFDGRKDKILIQIKEGKRGARKTITEEHVVLLLKPESKYVGHVTPVSSYSHNIRTSIFTFLDKNVNISMVQAIDCDGTVVNTSSKSAIREIELSIGRPLQCFICSLDADELPLCHLLQHLERKNYWYKRILWEIGKKL